MKKYSNYVFFNYVMADNTQNGAVVDPCLECGQTVRPRDCESKRLQTETSTTKTSTKKTSTNQNVYKPKRLQTKTSTNQNVYKPIRLQTKTSTNRNVYKPKRLQTKTSTNQNVYKPKWANLIAKIQSIEFFISIIYIK